VWIKAIALAGLMALAVLIHLHAPTVFFDSQLMLGTSAAGQWLRRAGLAGLLAGDRHPRRDVAVHPAPRRGLGKGLGLGLKQADTTELSMAIGCLACLI
jgi:hypothetical protein